MGAPTIKIMGPAILVAICLLIAIIFGIAVVMRGGPQLTEPRLQGTWQSDAEATIAEWRKVRSLNENQERLLKKTFGKLKTTNQGNTSTRNLDGTVESGTYRVLRKGKEIVVIKSHMSGYKDQVSKIRFTDNDTYWVYLDQTETWECFRRIK